MFTHTQLKALNDIQYNLESEREDLFTKSAILDLIGMGNYVLPVIGETTDLLLAPIASILLFIIYRNFAYRTRRSLFMFTEEILPFTDIIPTGLLLWYANFHMFKDKSLETYLRKKHNIKDKTTINQIKALTE